MDKSLKLLYAPMPSKWRLADKKGNCVAYIDARDVQERLDEVLGQGGWQVDYKAVKNTLFAGIGIKIGGEWIWKWDAGSESNVEAEKGEASDALKRAAVEWGVGRFLYEFPRIKISPETNSWDVNKVAKEMFQSKYGDKVATLIDGIKQYKLDLNELNKE